MKIVNRGYLLVRPTLLFVDWANKVEEEIVLSMEYIEGNLYLIEDDFMETEPILKANFKGIFHNEFSAVAEEKEIWPCPCNLENFLAYFTVEFGSTVFDTLKSNIKAD